MNYFIILLILVPLAWRLFSDYKKGVVWAVFLMTALSANPILLSGGVMPNFNMQRLILLVLLIAAVTKSKLTNAKHPIPFMGVLALYAAINLLPIAFSVDRLVSVKAYLAFTIEIVLFYFIISTSMTTKVDAKRIIAAGGAALFLVAVLAIIERYSGFNPVDAFMPEYVRKPQYVDDVLSTFPHRILLGTAMAMGWPLALALTRFGGTFKRIVWWVAICCMLLVCYLSFSRGPWIGALFAGAIMVLWAGTAIRQRILIVMVLIGIALMARPGAWDTITIRAQETADVDSFKGQTYQYRWELWSIAWSKISHAPIRVLFGFGQGSTEKITFDAVLSYSGETTALWSWDNHYAATLFEGGIIGLGAFMGLYGFFYIRLMRLRRAFADEDKTMHAALVASMTVMLFMMTNVAMFAPQLNYLLWALVPAGLRLSIPDVSREDENVITA